VCSCLRCSRHWFRRASAAGGGAYLYTAWPGAFTGIFTASLRREGWAALHTTLADSGYDGGAVGAGNFTMGPFVVPADCVASGAATYLQLNVQTSVGGFIAVGLRNASSGAWLDGFALAQAVPYVGNAIRAAATWSDAPLPSPWSVGASDVSALAGTPVVAVAAMQRASLFSWRFACVLQE